MRLNKIICLNPNLYFKNLRLTFSTERVIGKPYATLGYIFLTKKMALQRIKLNSINKLVKITYLRSSLRPLHALAEMPKSPLVKSILHPLVGNLQLPMANNITLASKVNFRFLLSFFVIFVFHT